MKLIIREAKIIDPKSDFYNQTIIFMFRKVGLIVAFRLANLVLKIEKLLQTGLKSPQNRDLLPLRYNPTPTRLSTINRK
jgi:hypothetical protein